ncbi:MAG: hypothetical protein BWK79_05895 [Beggiatoa sp. IS2]|nr:MAG: hypothetical protein BWK79_05895 [Beggiatoa sp. IS2]
MAEQENSQAEGMAQVIHEYRLAMADFNSAMKMREDLSIRIGRRTTHIIRFTMMAMMVLGSAMFYLIHTLTSDMLRITQHMDEMSSYMRGMSSDFRSVATHVDKMRLSVDKMNSFMESMPAMNTSVAQISADITQMTGDMKKMNQNMTTMSFDMMNMSVQFIAVNNKLGVMGYDVNRMSAPMKLFPFQ